MISLQLPTARDLGRIGRWFLPLPPTPTATDLADREAEVLDGMEYYATVARFIGFSSSQTPNHWDHAPGEYVGRGERCNACRWFELRIFRELDVDLDQLAGLDGDQLDERYRRNRESGDLGDFIVYKAGMSVIPGEVPYCRYDPIASPHQVVEALTTRRTTDDGQQVFMTRPSALALAAAARYDVELEDAYVNRAIV